MFPFYIIRVQVSEQRTDDPSFIRIRIYGMYSQRLFSYMQCDKIYIPSPQKFKSIIRETQSRFNVFVSNIFCHWSSPCADVGQLL